MAESVKKCARCDRYSCADGKDLCLPCLLDGDVTPAMRDSANCTECVMGYFAAEPEIVAQRYPDPWCALANPWCALYDEIIRRIRVNDEVLAKNLSKIRMTMRARQMRRGIG